MSNFPKYIKDQNGQIGTYAHLTFGDRPVYRFETGEFKLRQATVEELSNGSDRLDDLIEKERKQMRWKQLTSSEWEATGADGKFVIKKRSGKFWAAYASEDIQFNMPPKATISAAKQACEDNQYWEYAA